MAEPDPLAALYLRRHPRDAIAVLAGFDGAAVAALFDTLADDQVSVLLGLLPPALAAESLGTMSAARAAAHLGNMARRAAVAVLREMAPSQRDTLLQAIAPSTRLQLELILRQAPHRVGAWIDAGHIVLAPNVTVAGARQRLAGAAEPVDALYVVDGAQRLAGVVAVSRLLGAVDGQQLGVLATPPPAILRANATIDSALGDPAWDVTDRLPVVDRADRMIGTIRHAALRRAAALDRAGTAQDPRGAYLGLVNTVYVGLAEVLANSLGKGHGNSPPLAKSGAAR